VRRFNEENNEEAGEHWTPRDAVKLMARLVSLPVGDRIESGTYSSMTAPSAPGHADDRRGDLERPRRGARQGSRDGTVKLAESRLGRRRVGRVNGRDDDASRSDLRQASLPC
jgi:hypothetical protein